LGSFLVVLIFFVVLIIFSGGIIFGRLVEGLGIIKSSSDEEVYEQKKIYKTDNAIEVYLHEYV
jgi:hypothetical protein